MNEMMCIDCEKWLEARQDGTVGFHSSERYRTCPGSMKPGMPRFSAREATAILEAWLTRLGFSQEEIDEMPVEDALNLIELDIDFR